MKLSEHVSKIVIHPESTIDNSLIKQCSQAKVIQQSWGHIKTKKAYKDTKINKSRSFAYLLLQKSYLAIKNSEFLQKQRSPKQLSEKEIIDLINNEGNFCNPISTVITT